MFNAFKIAMVTKDSSFFNLSSVRGLTWNLNRVLYSIFDRNMSQRKNACANALVILVSVRTIVHVMLIATVAVRVHMKV